MIKALFFDLDGTLLTSERKLSARTKLALTQCREKGIKVFAATGRPPLLDRMLELSPEELGILEDGGVFYNGGCVCCNERKLYTTIPSEAVRISVDIINACQDANYAVQMVQERHSFRYGLANEDYPPWGVSTDEIVSFQSINDSEVIKIVIFTPWSRLPELHGRLAAAIGEMANIYLTGRDDFKSIDIVSKTINKRLGAAKAAALCGISEDEAAVFGDDYNDLEMLEGFGNSVAMGNACEEVKSHARHVTLSNDEDGIYHALKNILGVI